MNRRTTKQRTTIQDVLRSLYHPTAEEVIDAVRQREPSIGRATVFRNLALLTEEGVIYKVLLPSEPTRYDTVHEPHNHFLCRICRRIIDLSPNRGEGVIPIAGYCIESCSTTFYGVCPDCQTKQSEQSLDAE